MRQAVQRGNDRDSIGWLLIAIAGKQAAYSRRVDHVSSQHVVERRKRDRGVVKNLDRCAAGAKQNDRAEHRVQVHAQNELLCMLAHDHGLHGVAVHLRRWRLRAQACLDRHCGFSSLRGSRNVKDHAADIGFV